MVVALAAYWALADQPEPQQPLPETREEAGAGDDSPGRIDVKAADGELAATLGELNPVVALVEVEFALDGETVVSTASDLGMSLSAVETGEGARVGPDGSVREPTYLDELLSDRNAAPVITIDETAVQAALTQIGVDIHDLGIMSVGGVIEPVRGRLTGEQVWAPDMSQLRWDLETAVLEHFGPSGLSAGRVAITVPMHSIADSNPEAWQKVTELAEEANTITQGGSRLQLENTTEVLIMSEAALREFMVVQGEGQTARLAVDDRIANTLASLFVGIGEEGAPADFDVDFSEDPNGVVVISGGSPSYWCCDGDVAGSVLDGLRRDLPVIPVPSLEFPHPRGREWAESLGINQVVGEFTTRFKPGQRRVKNIDLISEITRGALIEPGEQWSVNTFVGPRTTAKGFVPAGFILNGVFTDSVGGGISQYATTLFNAAFFAGLDFVTYQSHSIYISRYPYGREATVSYPHPDLVIKNNTPYGVLIWPTTTSDSITVRLYSTPWVIGAQTGQTSGPRGACTLVKTERTRTWLEDGSTDTETVVALYRPEGTYCD